MDNIRVLIKKILQKNQIRMPHALSDGRDCYSRQVHRALERDEFEVYYQPQYNYNTKKLSGAEALMRWNTAEGMISPSVFIPELEKSGMIYEADKEIWRKVCRDLRDWKVSGLFVPHVSVNISGRDIYHADFEETIVSLVREHGLEARDLHLEITETAYVRDLKFMIGVIGSLQERGFIVEMDDFGSGYSSLKTLKNVPFDIIKLDMEFVQESETNEKAKNILTSVIDMLGKIQIPVIVEGVERAEQAELLNRLGCSYMQGYYFGKPTDREAFEKILKSGE